MRLRVNDGSMLMKRLVTTAVALCFWAPVVYAQNQAAEQMAVQFVSFPAIKQAQAFDLVAGEGEIIKVVAPTRSISPIYKVTRGGVLRLGKVGTDADGKPTFESYGQVRPLAAKSQLIIVIRKGKADADGLKLIPVSNANAGFKGGTSLMFNLSGIEIAGFVGGQKFALEPGKHKTLEPKQLKAQGDRTIQDAKIFFRKGDKAEPFFSSIWRYNEKARNLVFIYNEPGGNKLKLHVIRDYLF